MTDVEHHYAQLSDVLMHYVTAGQGPQTLVLLHGYPQSWYCWSEVIDRLGDRFRIIAPDLRGLGDTSRPVSGYDKKTIAGDVRELLHDHLGITQYAVAGHDWGGTVAFSLAADDAEHVTHLAVVDVAIPGDGNPNIGAGGKRWHHTFLLTPDLPEALIGGREDIYFNWFFDNYGHRPDVISAEARAEYLRTHAALGSLRTGFAYYRAVEQDVRDNQSRSEKLQMPCLAVGGTAKWGRGGEVAASLRTMAVEVEELLVDDCGHWVPEEQPDILSEALANFIEA
ncbi:alpha/beta fold hydrolase [Kineococcus rhizosphaerae]|uniref:Pimeloyl-ACP methyl ester carboxylesterase n=1 Tax=Kineococcus rhizosphaerae TaxID=559628 RepID=A0A2T0QSA4_9ACTN|nr:alpha/beta hydrolase [Kineococcus rhizosphaerae]PRY07799.1 pimeloyl-ACP methyl ester carboxylesterase [Kineococcus rhizosphaerae]